MWKMTWCTILLPLCLQFTLVWITWNEVQGKDFLVAVHRKSYKRYMYIYADPGEASGMIQVQYPSFGYKRSRTLSRFSAQRIGLEEKIGTTSGIEHNSILVTCSDDATKVLVEGDAFRYNIFSPLPSTALGTRYIVSSCDRGGQYRPFLVIATGAEDTDIDIAFSGRVSIRYEDRRYRHGDTLRLKLRAYQTFTLHSYYSLTGTVVNSTQSIALFTGLINSTTVVAYDQLLPVKSYSKEYVVAVDNNTALYNLQIISEDNGTLINFNNGSRAVVDGSGFYRRTLQQNELFHFTTTNPVMATLCRFNGQHSGFLVVPPVSLYTTQTGFRLPRPDTTAIILTSINTRINISSSRVTQVWTDISNSGYKVGEFRQVSRYNFRVPSDSTFTAAILFYQDYSIYNYGCSADDVTPVYTDTNGYIMAFPSHRYGSVYFNAVAESGGFWQVQYPHTGDSYTRQTPPYTVDRFDIRDEVDVKSGIENKSIIVNAKSDMRISFNDQGIFVTSISFSPLPISALGKKYIVPSCHNPYVNSSLLIIATANEMADITITFRLGDQSMIHDNVTYTDGDILRLKLQEYQTLTIRASSSLCGTTVSANRNVAVFSGTDDPFSYMQILPVMLYGQEYVAAFDQSYRYYIPDSTKYYVLIVSEHNDTQIMFDNTQMVSVGQRDFYRKLLQLNESIFFTTTRPVMVSVCMYIEFSLWTHGSEFTCSIVPPVSLYTYATGFVLLGENFIKIITDKLADKFNIKRSIGRSWTEDVYADWTDIPNSNYKVGTCRISFGTMHINSNTTFTILGYGHDLYSQAVFTAGYSFHRAKTETSRLPDSTTESPVHYTSSMSTDEAGQGSVTLAVGITCGCIILVLVIVITGLVIYIRRMIGSRGKKEDKQRDASASSPDSSSQHETNFTCMDKGAPAVADVAVISTGRTYAGLYTENQSEDAYEQIGDAPSTQGNPQYVNFEKHRVT